MLTPLSLVSMLIDMCCVIATEQLESINLSPLSSLRKLSLYIRITNYLTALGKYENPFLVHIL